MSKIYTIAVRFTYDCYMKSFFRYKFISKETEYYWSTPIFAMNEEEAIDIFKNRYDLEKCELELWCDTRAKNINKELVCRNNKEYSIDDLQRKMESQDFLHYCKQELGLEQAIDIVTSR